MCVFVVGKEFPWPPLCDMFISESVIEAWETLFSETGRCCDGVVKLGRVCIWTLGATLVASVAVVVGLENKLGSS